MSYQQRLDELRATRLREDGFIQELIEELGNLRSIVEAEQIERKKAVTSHDLLFGHYQKIKEELKEVSFLQENKRYAMVLIDGDVTNFRDALVQDPEEGGNEAGRLLMDAVSQHVKSLEIGCELDLHVRIYCNMKGLDDIYHKRCVLGQAKRYETFVRGLNKSSPFLDVVDAGDGKECADAKIRHALSSAAANAQCKHIIFGGSSDNGYARILGPLSNDEKVSSRITLLEGPPFAPEVNALKSKFRDTVKFPTVFRVDKMTVLHTTTPPSSSASYASKVVLNGRERTPPQGTKQLAGRVQLNAFSQRIDSSIPPYRQSMFTQVKNAKYCNLFHLRECNFSNCTHKHGERLKGEERHALQAVARWTPCSNGVHCLDPWCISGHVCPRQCPTPNSCRFPKQMHGVDQQVVVVL